MERERGRGEQGQEGVQVVHKGRRASDTGKKI